MPGKLLSGRRVLVVEDQMLLLMDIESVMVDLGCESVTTAATVEQALRQLEANVFDVAVLDVNLNGCESYPVAHVLAARGVPFAFSTGYGGDGIRSEYEDRPLLKKPYQRARLVQILTRLLAG